MPKRVVRATRRSNRTSSSSTKLVAVTQTHVLTKPLIDRLTQAHRQLQRRGIAYFVAFLIGDGPADRCDDPRHERAALLGSLRAALGAASVWCVDPPLFERVWPGFFRQLAKLPTRDRYSKRGAMGGWNWGWTQCDLHAQVGFWAHLLPGQAGSGASGREPDFLWVLDWDVAWTGDLARILKSFSVDRSDFLSFDAPRHEMSDDHYRQQKLRNYLSDSQVFKALVVPARYSRRMLGAVRKLVASGRHAFCETRSPSLCVRRRVADASATGGRAGSRVAWRALSLRVRHPSARFSARRHSSAGARTRGWSICGHRSSAGGTAVTASASRRCGGGSGNGTSPTRRRARRGSCCTGCSFER